MVWEKVKGWGSGGELLLHGKQQACEVFHGPTKCPPYKWGSGEKGKEGTGSKGQGKGGRATGMGEGNTGRQGAREGLQVVGQKEG